MILPPIDLDGEIGSQLPLDEGIDIENVISNVYDRFIESPYNPDYFHIVVLF